MCGNNHNTDKCVRLRLSYFTLLQKKDLLLGALWQFCVAQKVFCIDSV